MTGAQQAADPVALPDEGATVGEDVRLLIDQGKALAQAELAWQKARAAYAGRAAGGIAVLALLAAAFVTFALVALVVGALFALVPVLGPWGATGAVSGALVLLALVAAGIAALRFKTTARLIADKRDAA